MKKTIDSFSGGWYVLSNFYPVQVELDGQRYSSVEHAYQAAKTLNKRERAGIRLTEGAGRAKKLGRTVTMRPDWEKIKLSVMEALVRQKFCAPQLKELLLATGNAQLVEGNWWGDTFWGVCNGRGLNHLGLILMKIRVESKPTRVRKAML